MAWAFLKAILSLVIILLVLVESCILLAMQCRPFYRVLLELPPYFNREYIWACPSNTSFSSGDE